LRGKRVTDSKPNEKGSGEHGWGADRVQRVSGGSNKVTTKLGTAEKKKIRENWFQKGSSSSRGQMVFGRRKIKKRVARACVWGFKKRAVKGKKGCNKW